MELDEALEITISKKTAIKEIEKHGCDKCGILGDYNGGGIEDGIFYAHLCGLGEGNTEYVLCTECINKENK